MLNLYRILLIILLSLCTEITFSQSLVPASVNAGGGTFSNNEGGINFTVGEIVITNQENGNGTLSGGVSAATTITIVEVPEGHGAALDLSIFPNPTNGILTIQVLSNSNEFVSVVINDLLGKEYFNSSYSILAKTILIDTSGLAKGLYMLSMKNSNNDLLGSYKIIKE